MFSKHEERAFCFTDFLYSQLIDLLDESETFISRKAKTQEILYVSAAAQILFARSSRYQSLTLSEVSNRIVGCLTDSKSKTINNNKNTKSCEADHKKIDIFIVSQLWDEFEIETQRSGWIVFRFSKAGLDGWLTYLNSRLSDFIEFVLASPSESAIQSACDASLTDPRVWQAQYVHSRCCSLLRLWNAQVDSSFQVKNDTPVVLSQSVFQPFSQPLSQPPCKMTAQAQVIHALIALLDLAESDLFWIPYRYPSKQYFLLLKAVEQLCQSFEQFEATDLSGFGQISRRAALADKLDFQTRLAIAAIVQKALKVLLVRCLGVSAPVRL